MMTSSNGNIFRVTGPLCGEFTGPGEFPTQRPVTRSFDVFFDRRLNKRLSKQPRGWWLETLSCSLWRQNYEWQMIKVFVYNLINKMAVYWLNCVWQNGDGFLVLILVFMYIYIYIYIYICIHYQHCFTWFSSQKRPFCTYYIHCTANTAILILTFNIFGDRRWLTSDGLTDRVA